MKLHLTICFFLLGLSNCKASQQSNAIMKIESLKVYKYFDQTGFTTVGAYTHFDDLKKQGTQQLYVSSVDAEKLQQIMNRAKQMRHFQRKLAGGLIFCEMQFLGQPLESRVVISIGTEASGIMDLSARKDYVIKDSSDLEWLSGFIKRIKQE